MTLGNVYMISCVITQLAIIVYLVCLPYLDKNRTNAMMTGKEKILLMVLGSLFWLPTFFIGSLIPIVNVCILYCVIEELISKVKESQRGGENR